MSATLLRENLRATYDACGDSVQCEYVFKIPLRDAPDRESCNFACARALLKACGLVLVDTLTREEGEDLRAENELLRQDLAAETKNLADLEAAQREICELRDTIKSAKESAAEKDELIKSLENGINRMQGELTSLSGKLSKATSRADSFEAEARGKDKVIAEQSARLSAFFVKTAKLEEECVNHQLAYLNERDCADAIRFHRDLNASVANHATTENVKLQEEVASLRELNEDLGTINKAYRDLIDAKNEQLVEGEFVQPEAVVLNECVVNVFVNHGMDISSIVAKAINSKFDK